MENKAHPRNQVPHIPKGKTRRFPERKALRAMGSQQSMWKRCGNPKKAIDGQEVRRMWISFVDLRNALQVSEL